MACLSPLMAVDNGKRPDGKNAIKILPRRADFNLVRLRELYGDKLMMLPCGNCPGCAEDYSRMWQARILCEAQSRSEHGQDKASFLTLTYADNPPEKPLKSHLRHFIKACRNEFGNGLKFFGCGELGSETKRSHYHLILFGVDFKEDRIPVKKSGMNLLYRSSTLDRLWSLGHAWIGELDIASAGYVSKYCDKKKLTRIDSGEFVMMSRGLGRQYYFEHKSELFKSDYLVFKGSKFKIPRYLISLALKDDFYMQVMAQDYSARKKEVAINFRYDSCRSWSNEDEAMDQVRKIKEMELLNKGGFRDVY